MKRNDDDDLNYWREILEKFSSYNGTVINFCRENRIGKDKFYYYKKKFENEDKTTFHAITLKNNEVVPKLAAIPAERKNIRIEIGKANIYIPADETLLLSTILKELAKSC